MLGPYTTMTYTSSILYYVIGLKNYRYRLGFSSNVWRTYILQQTLSIIDFYPLKNKTTVISKVVINFVHNNFCNQKFTRE